MDSYEVRSAPVNSEAIKANKFVSYIDCKAAQPTSDAGAREGTGARCAAARERDFSLIPLPRRRASCFSVLRAPVSFADWKREKGLLCSLFHTNLEISTMTSCQNSSNKETTTYD